MRSEICAALFALSATWSACARHDPPSPHAEVAVINSPSSVASTPGAPSNAPSSTSASDRAQELTWSYPSTAAGPMSVVVSIPACRSGEHYPVLIAMHGRGEAFKGPDRGARGWIDDYNLYEALDRVAHPPLRDADFRGYPTAERLRRMNASLARSPFHGLIIVMPYTPDILHGEPLETAKPLAQFIVDELLPRVYRQTPAIGTAASTGIDGVSLGGRASISVGLLRPNAFGMIASLQAAFDQDEVQSLVEQAKRARAANPKLAIRLLTSDGDYFLSANRTLSTELDGAGIPHHLLEIAGPHDYVFNRGPGAYEMLLLHDRALRGEAPP